MGPFCSIVGRIRVLSYLRDSIQVLCTEYCIVDSMRMDSDIDGFIIRNTRYSEKLVRHTYTTHLMHDLSSIDPPATFYYWLRDVLSLGYSMGL